jgi:hypothetical protein
MGIYNNATPLNNVNNTAGVNNPNQLQYNTINPKAFDTNTVSKLFSNSNVDPLTGQYIDPTSSQGMNPGTVNPTLDQEDTSLTQY